jgi:hypothetical protein
MFIHHVHLAKNYKGKKIHFGSKVQKNVNASGEECMKNTLFYENRQQTS